MNTIVVDCTFLDIVYSCQWSSCNCVFSLFKRKTVVHYFVCILPKGLELYSWPDFNFVTYWRKSFTCCLTSSDFVENKPPKQTAEPRNLRILYGNCPISRVEILIKRNVFAVFGSL